ncbi:hypothetical protein BBJ28_00001540 [Nothophytophthora sp. Chile5]|nr:hypothetical protein BBJ28_00001540 [Nothophytophthora sp. Chile5]
MGKRRLGDAHDDLAPSGGLKQSCRSSEQEMDANATTSSNSSSVAQGEEAALAKLAVGWELDEGSPDFAEGNSKGSSVTSASRTEATASSTASTSSSETKPPASASLGSEGASEQVRGTSRFPRRRALVWFRRDLRLHDNLALQAAVQAQRAVATVDREEMALLPIYIIHRPVHKRCGAVRFQFLLESVQDLSRSLSTCQARLLVLHGDAEDVLRVVFPAWGVTDLFYEDLVMPYAVARDGRIRGIAEALDVNVTSFRGATLFDPHAIIRQNGGQVPMAFDRLLELTNKMPQPAHPVPAVTKLTNAACFSNKQLLRLLRDHCSQTPQIAAAIAGVNKDWHNDDSTNKDALELFAVPTLAVFGLKVPRNHSFLYGGEAEAMRILDTFCKDERRVGLFEKPRTSPVALDEPSTTSLSAHLALGCLSPREFFYRIMCIQLQFPSRPGPPQVTLDGQLMWREFFYCYAAGVPHFDSQERNPLCKQIDWRLRDEDPAVDHEGASAISQDADEQLAMRQLQCWKDGRTGFPWIDAVMRQINQEGWTHHAGRHAAACFLTRGVLYISWIRGAAYFQEKLIDLDWPINVGNWLWVSASTFFSDFGCVASPSTFPRRWDPKGLFIRKYVPELSHMPDKFVYEPWKAPMRVQRAADCLIGKDYPFPIVDRDLALRRCMAGMGRAYANVKAEMTPPPDSGRPRSPSWSDDMCYSYRSVDSRKKAQS